MSRFTILLVAGLTFVAFQTTSRGDTVKLEGGGTVRGQIIEDKSTKELLVVKTQAGAEIKIERGKIQEIIRERTPGEEYDEIKGDYAETAEEQFRLAMWCEARRLAKQRKEHLLKVIELDPDHAQGRGKLGYVRRDGKWMTTDELKESDGMVKYNGRFVTLQEKQILEQKKREDDATREWHQKIRQWKMWITGNDAARVRQGEDKLRAIDDPQAYDAIVGQFGKEKEESLRVLMCDLLNNLPGEEPTLELVRRSIADVSQNVRWSAVQKLVDREDPAAVRSLTKLLTADDNRLICRAAEALGAIGDPTAVPPLIDALVTKHKQIVTRGQQGSFMGSAAPTGVYDIEPVVAPGVVAFRPAYGYQATGAGFSKPVQEIVTVSVENQEVLSALYEITKEDYGYNQGAWKQWLAAQRRKEDLKNRRQIEDR